MIDHDRQAIAKLHRDKRLASTSGNAGTLADVERAALAYETKIADARTQLVESGYRDEIVETKVAEIALAWHDEKQSLEAIVANIEAQEKHQTTPDVPERTETMREDAAHFATLKGDRRIEAIIRARRGDDDRLAVALATLSDLQLEELVPFGPDRAALRERAAPGTFNAHTRANDIEKRIAGARATLAEVTQRLGATK